MPGTDMKNIMRSTFADTMLEVGKKDKNLIVLIGDISHFILQPFARACPGRFYNVGICEPTLVNMAAGLAKVGFYPVVHTITPFIVERSFEQIKDDFGYQRLGVNLVTVGSAFDYSGLGCTHHCYDDFALLKNVEGSQIIYPASAEEFSILFKETYDNGQITYFRLPQATHGVMIKKEKIKMGKGIPVTQGRDLTVVAVGSQLKTAMKACEKLQTKGYEAEVIYIHTIKPLDEKLIRTSILKTGKCLVIEEHAKYGGVFDDILRSSRGIEGAKFASMNIGDKFIHDYGTYEELCRSVGLTAENAVRVIKKELLKLK